MKKRVCNIYNHPSHYRLRVYQLLDNYFDCTFLFGDDVTNVKSFQLSELKNAKTLHVSSLGKLKYQKGVVKQIFAGYDGFVVIGSINNISYWLLLLLAKVYPKKKVYLWAHGLYGNETGIQIFFRRIFYGLSDGLIVYGDYAKNLLVTKKVLPSRKVFVAHNSLNYEQQLSLRKTIEPSSIYIEHFRNSYPVIIMIGRVNKRKRIDMLLDAVSLLASRNKYYNIVVVGDGEDQARIVDYSAKLGLSDRIWFYGPCYDEKENAELLYNADLCVVPGDVGLSAIHSMTFGTPVISHDNFSTQGPEFEVIKDHETGLFFKKNSVEDLAAKIEEWFEIDSTDREATRNNCFNIIDDSWTPMYQFNVIKNLL